ncbi:MAG: endolytic transglycosylase MltG [Gammaproteobacteria bacterium]|nr:endolytic transglycosylase MltG [Gammaproteobacteria bacterium]
MIKLFKKLLVLGLLVCIGGAVVLAYQLIQFQLEPIKLSSEQQTFTIKSGSNIKVIAQQLSLEKVIDGPWLFILMARVKGVETKVRAGEYRLQPNQTTAKLLDSFVTGLSIQYSFTIIEGWSFHQMLQGLKKHPVIINTLEDKTYAEIMVALGLPGQHPEGIFFPDTYSFPKGTTDIDFLHRAYQLMQRHLAREWKNRAADLPLDTSYEALILASIVEKETGAAFERPLIAGVFAQRLRRKMRLQTDPTVIYGLGADFDGNIRFRDLKKDTPYNTYLRKGLTPTPIALPGLESIKAALHPADTRALYFVAKGDGTHQFSETLEEHNRAVSKFQLNGRKAKRKATSG